jgi:hypothetical protein
MLQLISALFSVYLLISSPIAQAQSDYSFKLSGEPAAELYYSLALMPVKGRCLNGNVYWSKKSDDLFNCSHNVEQSAHFNTAFHCNFALDENAHVDTDGMLMISGPVAQALYNSLSLPAISTPNNESGFGRVFRKDGQWFQCIKKAEINIGQVVCFIELGN